MVVAPDKFKGTLTAIEAARAMRAGVSAALPGAEVTVVALADGGEGTLEVVLGAVGGDVRTVEARDPLGRRIRAPLARLRDGRIVLESATVCGLALLDTAAPLMASSVGVGDLIRHALDAREDDGAVVVGVGGTASTDGGTGMARALGWRFVDRARDELPPGGGALGDLHAIDAPGAADLARPLPIVAACDVINPPKGPRGAARVFGPQKGASSAEVDILERGLERLTEVIRRDLGVDVDGLPHGGAGGGLGAGLVAFCGAELVSGFDLVASAAGLDALIARADVVVTGEGRVDAATAEGKVVSGVVERAAGAGARCLVVAGEVDRGAVLPGVVDSIDLVARYGDAARGDAARCITRAVAQALAT
ncbi:MAG TPA: glycerate kinase [Actinomycetota bacterium]